MTSALAAVQKATDLVRLAADAGAAEGEARNAALMAARLIAKHGLQIVDPASLHAAAGPKNGQSHPWRSRAKPADPHAARRIDNRFPSRCRVCGDAVDIGERVWWRPGLGVAHIDCGDEW